MPTVPRKSRSIRNRTGGALLCGAAIIVLWASGAQAQELGKLRGETDENFFIFSQASGAAEKKEGLQSPDYSPSSTGATDEEAGSADAADFENLDPLTTAATPEQLDPETVLDAEIPEPPARVLPVAPVGPVQGTGGKPDTDPYAAQGIRLGSFILRPRVELGLTGSRETSTSESGAPPVVSETTTTSVFGDSALRLQMDSDWDRHAVNVTATGRLQRTLHNGDDLKPELAIDGSLRLDLGADTTLTAKGGYGYQQEDPKSAGFFAATDPGLIPVVTGVNDPATQSFNGALELRRELGALFGEAEVSADRSIYGAAKLSDGATVSQHDLDNTVYSARLRAGFEASPVFSPFIEGSYGVRRMGVTPDSGGADRNAKIYALRLGTGIDLGEKVSGEISAGYLMEDIADAALADIAGVSVDAALNWSPRRETDVRLALSTTTETSGGVGDSGALLYSADLGVTHRMRADLTAEAGIGAEYRDATGTADETTLSATASLTYWFNRFAGVTTRVGHEQTLSTDPLNRSRKTTGFVGLTLQR